MREVLPDVRFLQTYGLSEVGVLRSQSKDSDSLWVKVGGEGFETKVVDGTLWIRAASAMVGYLNAPSPFDEEGWLNTEDLVEVDGDYIRILGRSTDIINVGGQKVYPAEVESVLLEMKNVRDATVHGEANAILGAIVVARLSLFEPEDPRMLKERVRRFCRRRLAPYKVPVRIEVVGTELFGARYKRERAEGHPLVAS
jgi:long-chain acyl-CoA synthetase